MKLIEIPQKPDRDYRQLRAKGLNSPEFSHLKLLIGWVIYFLMYALTENLIPESRCHEIHSELDDMIPFTESFVIWYCFWFVLVFCSLLYFLVYDVESFKRLQTFIMVTQAVAMVVYIVYPSVQHMRPQSFDHQNIFTFVLTIIYGFDTPTGICPSLHVGYSMGIVSTWLKYKGSSPAWKIFVVFAFVMISLSTLFIKQHSAVDVIAALPLGFLAEFMVYNVFYKREKNGRFEGKRTENAWKQRI